MSNSDNSRSRPLANKRLSRSGDAGPKKPSIKVRTAKQGGSERRSANKSAPYSGSKPRKPLTMHPRNPHQGRYDMEALVKTLPQLEQYLTTNPRGEQTIDFADSRAVVCLNQALLKHHYGVEGWDIPAGYLCPPIPGRADYIHYAADLLNKYQLNKEPVRVLDIGTGANLIYSLLGACQYQWNMLASDIDETAIRAANDILTANPALQHKIEVRQQPDDRSVFRNLIQPGERFALSVCNPPFYASAEEAQAENLRKQRNLSRHQQKRQQPEAAPAAPADRSDPWGKAKVNAEKQRNFGGQNNELWCEGGELAFLKRMTRESQQYGQQVAWFTSLISKQENVPLMLEYLKAQGVKKTEVVKMAQGQKISRFIAWCF
ncbi:23S rRNA (adenine(1618)-N(6))-methyltransferase RlmF [Bacterioplanoides sp.]|uniref:23S rRNA (adenine(1618)-N(6))-methyltransferase RlmF n=1 Tax=Bacterioplanoides sp. TaxID=2066072 RepID=UPI003B5C8A33